MITAFLLLMTGIAWGQARTVVTDTLTREMTGVSGNTYTSWSDVTSNSEAVYAGQSAGNYNSIQLRSNNNTSGIITTTSGGTVSTISVVWNSNTQTGRTLSVYGKDSAYSSPSDLYNAQTQGTLIGTIVKDTSTELTISDSYSYIGLRSESGAMYLEKIYFTWTTGGSSTQNVATPTFSPAAGTYSEAQNVTINCTTQGATIHYTLDGTNPTLNSAIYSTPIAISQTTTVKAMAVKQGMTNSAVATATYTIQQTSSLTTINEIWDLAESVGTTATQASVTFNNWYVSGVKGGQAIITDGQYGFVIYQNSHGFNAGDKLNGTVTCNVLLYQNHYAEITGVHASDLTVTPNQEMPMLNTTIGTLSLRNYGTPIDLGTLTYDGSKFNDESGAQITPYNNFNLNPNPVNSLAANTQYNVKGVYIVYWQNGNPVQQVAPRSADDFEEYTSSETVATPTFSPAAGTYHEAQNVTIACATQGATIHYTIDGSDPTVNSTTYSNPIAVSQSTTVKALAVKQGMTNSAIATAVYTIEDGPSVITIAEARALELDEYALVQGVVTFIDGRNVYVQDATAGIDLYLNNNTVPEGLASGDMVQAYGKKAVFRGLVELSNINGTDDTQFQIISSGNTLPLAVKTIAEINADAAGNNLLQSSRVKIVEATVGTINNNNNTPISQGENTLNIYKMPVVDGLAEGDIATVIGVIGCYNAVQLRVASADDVTFTHSQVETVATPTFSPAAGTYSEAQNVTISCATEGATIHYTLDGTDPTANSATYSNAIAISETTTVKAMAVKQGMTNSAIAIAAYTINTTPPAQETAYTLITNANALVVGDKYIIVGIKGEGYKALGKQATNNRVAEDVTPVDNVITLTPATTNEGGVFELILDRNNDNWTLYDAVNEGYLYAASSSANQLKVQAENDANGQWSIDIASDGVATIKAQGSNTRNWLRLNNTGSPFSCYGSGQLDVYLYKAGDVPTPPQPTYFNVTVANDITNGTVTVDKTSALENDTIHVTAIPNTDYELTTLTYSYTGSASIDIKETKWFLMPAAEVTVNATFTQQQTVATPALSLATGTFIQSQVVSITCATEGATIYYTLDGNDPTPNSSVYSQALNISETTTVKAMAVKEGLVNSAIASATYTFPTLATIAEAKALNTNEYALVQGVVTFIDGRNVYVQDETAGIDLYLNNNTVPTTLAVGDLVLAYGKKAVYNGLIELSSINGGNINQFVVVSNGNELPLAVKTIAEILEDAAGNNMLQSTRVQIVEAVIGTINTNNNTPITQDESTLNIYKIPVVEGLEEGDLVTVIGVIGCYNNPQLRVNSPDDVEFTHPAYPALTANPSSLAGFTYVEDNGPSNIKSFVLTGSNLTSTAFVYPSENFQISTFGGDNFVPENRIRISTISGNFSYNIYVRLKADLAVGTYEESLYYCSGDTDTTYMSLSGNVTPQGQGGQSSDYARIFELSQLGNGAKVIFAARFDNNVNNYYAMTAQASGKPEGVLFTSVTEDDSETLPSDIADEESTYYWTVATDGTNYTFTNANGDVLGYTSSTNFATGGDNTAWTITCQTSEATAMVPEYTGFVVNNVNNAVRAFALNSNHNFGPYHTQNMASENYNFFLDIFATTGSGTMTCATPAFTPEAGTYYEAQEVTITCNTADAVIHYTTDGTDPTENSAVYNAPITVSESMTIKAIAMKEGYENSNIATAEYTIIVGAATIFNQDWEGEMNGWTFVTVEGNKPWNISQYNGNHYAYANGYNGGVNEQWCISPAFNLNNYSNVTLTFRNAKNYTGPDVQLFFSNDYDGEDPTNTTWTELEFNKSTGSYAWAESGTIEFTGFAGDNCYIGFKYTSTENQAAAWEIDDITLMGFTSAPYLTVTPASLSGFTHIVGEGPSASQTFVISGGNLPDDPNGLSGVTISCDNNYYEMSLDNLNYYPYLGISVVGTLEPTTIYVRLNGEEVGTYEGTITIEDQATATVTLSGTVTEPPVPGGEWTRILSLNDLANGDQVIIASRYDANVSDGYYAMTAGVSGKPDGILFTSVNDNGMEMLPDEITAEADTYLWNVILEGDVITLVNAAGDSLGYSSSTNFSGNVSTDWNIAYETSSENALIPNYNGFVITNAETTNRGVAKNASHKFGAYSTSNLNNTDYNFYLDLFVQGGSATPTVATPVFSVASGTYYEEFDVEITCGTEGAVIYYTTDGTDPTSTSTVYDEAIHVDHDMTLKAIAMKEGFDDSNIATANYVIMTGLVIILDQDWEGEMDGWTFVTVEGNKPWTIGQYAGNKYANANGYNDDVDNEQWCISPVFNLNEYANQNVTLTFRNATKFEGPALELYFTNDYDGQDPTTATWQPLSYIASEGNYVWTESGEISLNAFSGTMCNIGFKYISTVSKSAAAWEVDDILLVANMSDEPYLTATPNALSGFYHEINAGPSEAQTFVLTGGNLPPVPGSNTGSVTLTVNSYFEISLDGEEYSTQLTIQDVIGTLEPTTVYVRLNGEEIGEYEAEITIEDYVTTTVSLSGTVDDVNSVTENLAGYVNAWSYDNQIMIENNCGNTLQMVVYNVLGQPVMGKTIATGSMVLTHNLTSGMYIITLSNNQGMVSTKMVVR